MTYALQIAATTVTCTRTTAAARIGGGVILLAIVGAIIWLAIANASARRRLSAANGELNYLRPENDRLQEWIASLTGVAPGAGPQAGYATGSPAPAQWYPDPSGRHELRRWDGTAWTSDVSDHGVSSTDAMP